MTIDEKRQVIAISWAWTAVEMHRAAQKRRDAE